MPPLKAVSLLSAVPQRSIECIHAILGKYQGQCEDLNDRGKHLTRPLRTPTPPFILGLLSINLILTCMGKKLRFDLRPQNRKDVTRRTKHQFPLSHPDLAPPHNYPPTIIMAAIIMILLLTSTSSRIGRKKSRHL